MSEPTTLGGMTSATSLLVSGDGAPRCKLQDGITLDLFGQEAVPASHSVPQEIERGKDDERHLWPHWFRLIRECKPAILFGEQVATAITHRWLDDVANDLEGESYSIGSALLPACAVGAPHKRDRLWFVAYSESQRWGNGDDSQLQRQGTGEIYAPTVSSCIGRKLGAGRWAREPDMGRLAHGVLNKVEKLRAYGNAIVPQVAAEFIKAAM